MTVSTLNPIAEEGERGRGWRAKRRREGSRGRKKRKRWSEEEGGIGEVRNEGERGKREEAKDERERRARWSIKYRHPPTQELYIKTDSLGIVVTTSPTCKRYNMVVFPAPSNPRINTRNSFGPHRPAKRREKNEPTKAWRQVIIIIIIFATVNDLPISR